jgi:hypothetical protein
MMLPFVPANSRIVLVGNSKGIIGNSLGPTIDSFDIVVRFNNFEIGGFEESVGRKIDIICRRSCDDVKLHDASNILKVINFVTYGKWFRGMYAVDKQLKLHYRDKLHTVNHIACGQIGSKIGLDQPDKEWASVGALACGLFADNHNPSLISICGFDFCESHYFKKPPKDGCYHNWQKEEKFIKSLGFNFLTH